MSGILWLLFLIVQNILFFFAPSKHFRCCNEPSGPRAPGTPAEILFQKHPVSWPSTSQSVSQSAAVVKSCNLVSTQIFGGRGHSTCQKTKSNHVKVVLVCYVRPQYTRKIQKYWKLSQKLVCQCLNCVHFFLVEILLRLRGIFWALKEAILLLMFI